MLQVSLCIQLEQFQRDPLQNCKYSAYQATHLLRKKIAGNGSELRFHISYWSVFSREVFSNQIRSERVFFFSDFNQKLHTQPKKSFPQKLLD